MAIVDNLKLIHAGADEQLITNVVEQCKVIATDYCNLLEYDNKLDNIVMLMADERLNKINAAGISSRSFSGISESYTDDFSPLIYKGLRKHKKLKKV